MKALATRSTRLRSYGHASRLVHFAFTDFATLFLLTVQVNNGFATSGAPKPGLFVTTKIHRMPTVCVRGAPVPFSPPYHFGRFGRCCTSGLANWAWNFISQVVDGCGSTPSEQTSGEVAFGFAHCYQLKDQLAAADPLVMSSQASLSAHLCGAQDEPNSIGALEEDQEVRGCNARRYTCLRTHIITCSIFHKYDLRQRIVAAIWCRVVIRRGDLQPVLCVGRLQLKNI